jgi:putative ABC transport system permease protein
MSFFALVIKNLLRRRMRSLLTVIGIAVGIAAVVALTSIAWGFERGWANTYRARGTDLIVAKSSNRSALPAPFPADIQPALLALPHVKDAPGTLADIMSIEDSPTIVVQGWESGSFLWDHLKLEQGRWPDPAAKNEVLLGTIAAEMLGKAVGDEIQIETTVCTVCGLISSSALTENGSIILPLGAMQALTNRPGMVNFYNLRLAVGTSAQELEQLRALVKARFKGLTAFNAGQVAQASAAIQIAKAMSLATSLIALVVGTVGIMNTILMSVFERLQEIGVLLAIGWRRARILRLILCESLVLSLAGGVVGCALGVAAVRVLQTSPWIHGKLEGEIDPPLLGVALLIALGLGALGGLYPAWIGSRMSPVTALHHE